MRNIKNVTFVTSNAIWIITRIGENQKLILIAVIGVIKYGLIVIFAGMILTIQVEIST